MEGDARRILRSGARTGVIAVALYLGTLLAIYITATSFSDDGLAGIYFVILLFPWFDPGQTHGLFVPAAINATLLFFSASALGAWISLIRAAHHRVKKSASAVAAQKHPNDARHHAVR